MDNQKVRFVRIHGRIVPIRKDKGVDMRSNERLLLGKRQQNKAYNKAIKDSLIKDPAKIKKFKGQSAQGLGVAGVIFGGAIGGQLGAIKGSIFKKGIKGALIGGVIGALAGHSRSDFIDKRKFNKSYGASIRKFAKKDMQ